MSANAAGANALLLESLSRNEGILSGSDAKELEQQMNDPILLAEFYTSFGEQGKAFNLLEDAADMRAADVL
ncbi:MAG TPA: hypothetical protein VFB14_06840 [Bryobacteraceae bacterium]|nr:hypothetical protein [Bryobacteraceae bacterium]